MKARKKADGSSDEDEDEEDDDEDGQDGDDFSSGAFTEIRFVPNNKASRKCFSDSITKWFILSVFSLPPISFVRQWRRCSRPCPNAKPCILTLTTLTQILMVTSTMSRKLVRLYIKYLFWKRRLLQCSMCFTSNVS